MKVSELKKQLKPTIERNEMTGASGYILSMAQACLRFRDLGKFENAPIGATRFGGDADLPKNLDWPVDPNCEQENDKLLFVALVNLEQTPRWRGSPLPKKGLLSVFLGINGFQGEALVHYFPSTKRLERVESPGKAEIISDYQDETLQPIAAEAEIGLSIPATLFQFQEQVAELCGDSDALDEDYVDDSYRDLEKAVGPEEYCAQMLGFAVPPYLSGHDYHDQASAIRNGVDAYKSPTGRHFFSVENIPKKQDRDKVVEDSFRIPLLLSMDSSNQTGAMWSDAGLLYILCHEQQINSTEFGTVPSYIYH